jgi:hypothetical protein
MGFFDAIKAQFSQPGKVATGIVQGVATVAEKAAEFKAKVDYLNEDPDHNGKSNGQEIQEQAQKIVFRVNGDPALKVAPADETAEAKAKREAALAAEETTMKLLKETQEKWTKEARFYQVECTIFGALVGGFFNQLVADHTQKIAGLPQAGNEVA